MILLFALWGVHASIQGQDPPPCSTIQCDDGDTPLNDESPQPGDDVVPSPKQECAFFGDDISNECFRQLYERLTRFLVAHSCNTAETIDSVSEDLQRILVLCQNACMPSQALPQQGRLLLDSDANNLLPCESSTLSERKLIVGVNQTIHAFFAASGETVPAGVLDVALSALRRQEPGTGEVGIDTICQEPQVHSSGGELLDNAHSSEPALQMALVSLITRLCDDATGISASSIGLLFEDLNHLEVTSLITLTNSSDVNLVRLAIQIARTASICWGNPVSSGCGQPLATQAVTALSAARSIESLLGCLIASGQLKVDQPPDALSLIGQLRIPSANERDHKGEIDILSTSWPRKTTCIVGAVAALMYNESNLDFVKR